MKQNKIEIISLLSSIIVIIAMLLLIFLPKYYHKSTKTEIKVTFANHTWNRFAPMDAEFTITNKKKTYEVAVSLGVVNGFELDNVPLEIVITAPNGQKNILDRTIVVKKDGNYLGKAYGDVWTTELVIYREKQFSAEGTYTVSIQNRTQYYDLENVESLVFSVRPAKKMKNEE